MKATRGLLLVSAAWAAPAMAGDKPIYAPAPGWVKPAPPIDVAKLDDASPVMLVYDAQQRLEKGEVTSYQNTMMRIATAQTLDEAGTVSLQWQPDHGDLTIHAAEIVRGAERIDLAKAGDRFTVLRREEGLERREIDGTLTATMQVEGLRVGDVLHLAYSITNRDTALGGRMQAFAPLLADPFRAQFARSRLIWPAAEPVRFKAMASGVEPRPVAAAGYREIEIALPLAKQPEMPDDAPLRYRRPPLLEASTFADWADVSRTMAPLFAADGLIAPGSPLAAEVETIRKASADPLVRAQAALALVQGKIRYLAVGMDGGNYRPQPPERTWTLRYGDCKAKTLLLLALLDALDIAAEPVLASAQLSGLVAERLPSAGAFDHVLVRATIGDRVLWLDGTGQGARLADIGDTPPLRDVLPLRAAGAALMPVPMRANARPFLDLTATLDDSAGLGLPTIVDAAMTMRGPAAEGLPLAYRQANAEQRRLMMAGALKPFFGEAQIASSSVTADPVAGTATLHMRGIVTTGWRRDGRVFKRTVDRAIDGLRFDPDRAKDAWRAIPVQVSGPGSVRFRATYRLPQDGQGFTLEGDTTLPAGIAGYRLQRTARLADGAVTVDDVIDAGGGEIAVADIPAARAALAQARARMLAVSAPAAYPARWDVVQAARRGGGLKALEAVFAAAIADDPAEVTGYRSRASLRAGVYDYAGAVADWTKVIEIEPGTEPLLKRAGVYRTIGEDAKARADAEAALKLDPSSEEAMGLIVGIRSQGGDTKGALALVDERIAVAGRSQRASWLSTKADVYAEARDVPAALATIDTAIGERPGDADLLNARCWIKGRLDTALDTALKDCTRAIELSEYSAAPLDSRALIYYRMGRMEEALADLDAALAEAPSQAASLFLRGVVRRRMSKPADAEADLAAAQGMAPQVAAEYARWGIRP